MYPTSFLALFLSLILLSSGCTVQTLYDQVPPATREIILDMDVQIRACNSYLFVPRVELGPEAICITLFTQEHAEEFGVDLSASSIAFDEEPRQSLLELITQSVKPNFPEVLDAEIRRGHIARYSVSRTSIPKTIILFPTNTVQSHDGLLEVSPIGTKNVNLDLMFTFGDKRQQIQRSFKITSRKKITTLLDL